MVHVGMRDEENDHCIRLDLLGYFRERVARAVYV
jgi:hypothetical protein